MRAMLTLTGTQTHGEPWTSIDGLFELTDPAKGLGLTNVRITHRGMDGKRVRVGLLDPSKTGGFDLTGLKLKFAPNGTLFVEFDELAATNLKVKAGDATIKVPLAKLTDAAIGLEGLAPGQALDVLGAKLREIEVQGIKVLYTVNRSIPSSPSGKAGPPDPWVLDALSGMDGTIKVKATGTALGDVTIPAQIRSGVIDFDRLTADDGYFLPGDVWFFIDEKNIWARQWKIPETLYKSPKPIPGVTPAEIDYTTPMGPNDMPQEIIHTRGQLNLKEFLEGNLNDVSSGSGKPPEQLDSNTSNLKINGDLQPGDGVLGKSKNNVTLSGKSAGKNKISISAAKLGKRLTISMPEFQAKRSQFEFLGKQGETGLITANVKLVVKRLGSAPDASGHLKFKVQLTVADGKIRDVRFGNVALAEASALRTLPAPPEDKTP